jgi:hypothetical protein
MASIAKVAREQLHDLLLLSQKTVEAMSDDEVAIRWYVYRRQTQDHLLATAMVVPPREAWPLLKASQAQANALKKAGLEGANPTGVYISIWRFRRRIDALRIVEAVRDHLAKHDGKLPEDLSAISEFPIPLDPLTERPFRWEVSGNTATLTAHSLSPEQNALTNSKSSGFDGYRVIVK